ncbi:hypothetical protein MKZ38_003504 [Zalerion maritima]|uniref:UBX domain-containing protein n=1 Tax=Zalerion maritima TaxID=339359 RepID=A0AAD5WV79_9PEZI|nr:hypothetical protein MKZ38_003504 [Zalerion maritima]
MAEHPEVDTSQLSPDQQEALQQYAQVTDQDVKDAIPILERSQWNVQIAVTKFFDGDGPDPVAEAMAAETNPPRVAQRHENLQESFLHSAAPARRPQASRPEPAPRIVPQQPVVRQMPFVLAVILAPFSLAYKAASTLFRTVFYFLSFVPLSMRPRILGNGIQPLKKNASGRRMLLPRDTAARFKREFEEEYGENDLSFFDGGFAQALDLAKRDLKFLLVVLISPEHDDTESFARETLLSPEVVNFINDKNNDIILWGGNILDTEAYQVSLEYSCTKFPFSAMISLTPKEGSAKMSIIKRLSGPMPPRSYVAELQKSIEKYAPELAGVKAQRQEHEMARNLRSAQDEAYERSLAADRERARQKREVEAAAAAAERAAREAEEAAGRKEQLKEQWKKWRAGQAKPEPEASNKDVVRLAIKMRSGERVVRRFDSLSTMEDLYAFVECFDDIRAGTQESAPKPEGYAHEYKFRVASIMPRELFDPHGDGTLRDRVGRSGNLIVEDVVEETDE